MIVDSSAVVAVMLGEHGSDRLARAIERSSMLRMSAVTLVEASIVMARYLEEPGVRAIDRLLASHAVTSETVTLDQAAIARAAFLRFGKGRHPAALNFGDCFSYALAVARDEPLLFVGGDFALTDVRVADT